MGLYIVQKRNFILIHLSILHMEILIQFINTNFRNKYFLSFCELHITYNKSRNVRNDPNMERITWNSTSNRNVLKYVDLIFKIFYPLYMWNLWTLVYIWNPFSNRNILKNIDLILKFFSLYIRNVGTPLVYIWNAFSNWELIIII